MITHFTGYPGSRQVYAHDDQGEGFALVIPMRLAASLKVPFNWGISNVGSRALAMALALVEFPDDVETAFEVHDHILRDIVAKLPHNQKFRLEAVDLERCIMTALEAWGPFSTTHPATNPATELVEDVCPDAKYPFCND